MKGRLPYAVILSGSLAFLVSLYFTWIGQHRTGCASASGAQGLLCEFDPYTQVDGWDWFGQAAAVFAVALAGAALAALVRPHLASRFPFGKGALALGIFALLSVASLWQSMVVPYRATDTTAGLAPASYVGLASVGVVCVAATAMRWSEFTQIPSLAWAVGQLLSLGVIASFLLAAFDGGFWGRVDLGLFICAFACLSMWALSQTETQVARLAVAAAMAALVASYLLPLRSVPGLWPYELWLLAACTAALLGLSLVTARGLRLSRPAASDMAFVAAGVLLLVSLFLPWQAACSAGCVSESGWDESTFAGVCVLALLVGLVWLRRFLGEFAIGAAIFTAATFGSNLRYGWLIGFVAAMALLVFALLPLRPVPGRRFAARLVPEIAALAVLALNVSPLARTSYIAKRSPWIWLGLLAAIATVGTVRLLVRWCGRPRDSVEVVLLPLGLLVLTTLDLIYVGANHFHGGISWEGWVSVVLCLLLIGCGWVERYGGGLDRFRIPEEIWRIDRLPAVED